MIETPEKTINYTVRVSARAKRVNLHVKPHTGLEVVIPKRFDRTLIPGLLQENLSWIEEKLDKWSTYSSDEVDWPPQVLHLRAIDSSLRLVLLESGGYGKIRARLQDDNLLLSGNTQRQELVISAIEAALKSVAKPVLAKLLSELSRLHALPCGRLTVRGQKTRWGSCSSSGNISLNYKLLFLPPELVRYVVLHELAHTRHMNHSSKFWQLLETLDPAARDLDRQLADTSHFVPWWLHD